MARKYAIVNNNAFRAAIDDGEIDLGVLFASILETNMDTLRYSLDGSEFVIKTSTEEAATYLRTRAAELGIPYVEYSHDAILVVMSSNAWSDPTPFA